MRTIRIYHPTPIEGQSPQKLTKDAAHHLIHVLRLQCGDNITLFDGNNTEYHAVISGMTKSHVEVDIPETIHRSLESPLKIHLFQAIIRFDKLDWIIQKATELGITEITPVQCQRSQMKLNTERFNKKWQHWQKIMINACEQCGRNQLPRINTPDTLPIIANHCDAALKLVPHPNANTPILSLASKQASKIAIVIGPEGGFTKDETSRLTQHDFINVSLGPRILRAETASISSISLVQSAWGDLN